jgi:hypothetical protein
VWLAMSSDTASLKDIQNTAQQTCTILPPSLTIRTRIHGTSSSVTLHSKFVTKFGVYFTISFGHFFIDDFFMSRNWELSIFQVYEVS